MAESAVGVIVGTYRRPALLARALASVVAQSYPAARILVCDDGSGDDTKAVVERFAADSAVPVVWLTQPHSGHPGRTRNQALASLDGLTYVAFLDDDDWWRPEKLARQLARLQAGDVDVLGCGIEAVDPTGQTLRIYRAPAGPFTLQQLAVRNPMATSGVVMRSRLFLDLHGFNEHPHLVGWGDDYDLWLRAAAIGGRVANVPDPLVVYREGAGIAAAQGGDPGWRAVNLRLIANGLGGGSAAGTARRILYGRHFAEQAESELAAGRRTAGLVSAARAIVRFPAKSSWAVLAHMLRPTLGSASHG